MSNPIAELPPQGDFVYVTDFGITVYAAFWNGHWRDTLADGGWLEFSDAATWSTTAVKPASVAKPKPTLAQAEAEVANAEADLNAAEGQ